MALVKRLLGEQRDIRIFDPNVQLSQLIGANREFLMPATPTWSACCMTT